MWTLLNTKLLHDFVFDTALTALNIEKALFLILNLRSWVIKVLLWTSYARLVPLLSLWLLSLTQFTKSAIAIIECFIQLSGGIITTATFTLMMLSSQNSLPGAKATHCAVLATSEVLGKLLMISLSGILVDIIGYQYFFGLCFLLALSFLPVLKHGLVSPREKSS